MEQQTPPTEPVEESIFSEEDYSMEGYDKHVRNARITLYEVAGLFLLGLFLIKDMEDVAGKIMTAILIGLIIFVSLQIFNAIADPSTR